MIRVLLKKQLAEIFRSYFYDAKKNKTLYYIGKTEGRILTEKEGHNGFGYDPVFYSFDLGKSMGVATAEEKNSVSHRARAMKGFLDKFISEIK